MTESDNFQAMQIVDQIIDDITGRKGLGNEWEDIEPDIRDEIRDGWIAIAEDVIRGLGI